MLFILLLLACILGHLKLYFGFVVVVFFFFFLVLRQMFLTNRCSEALF